MDTYFIVYQIEINGEARLQNTLTPEDPLDWLVDYRETYPEMNCQLYWWEAVTVDPNHYARFAEVIR